MKERIPHSKLFDIEEIRDKNSKYPRMLPSLEDWRKNMRILGIRKNNIVILYDDFGVTGACRAWWMFKYFGHEKAYIMNGKF